MTVKAIGNKLTSQGNFSAIYATDIVIYNTSNLPHYRFMLHLHI